MSHPHIQLAVLHWHKPIRWQLSAFSSCDKRVLSVALRCHAPGASLFTSLLIHTLPVQACTPNARVVPLLGRRCTGVAGYRKRPSSLTFVFNTYPHDLCDHLHCIILQQPASGRILTVRCDTLTPRAQRPLSFVQVRQLSSIASPALCSQYCRCY